MQVIKTATRTIHFISLLFLFSIQSNAQSFSVDGITGITFDTTGGDFTTTFTDQFTVFGIAVTPVDLTIAYTSEDKTLQLSGPITSAFDSESIQGELSLIIVDGGLFGVSIGVTGNFNLRALQLTPTNMGFVWTGGNTFGIFGDVTASLAGNDMTVSLSDQTDPGIVIENGQVTSISMSVTGNFDLKALTIEPQGLTFAYDTGTDVYEMYGDAVTTVGGNQVTISMGDETSPGIMLDNGNLTNISFGVSADFAMYGVTITPNSLTFAYDFPNDVFEFFGGVTIGFDSEQIDALLGDADNPGIVIDNGNVTQVNFGLSSEFTIKSLSIIPDSLTFQYNPSEEYYAMYGSLSFKIGSDVVGATMGDMDNPGLVFDNGSITNVNIGITQDFTVSGLNITTENLGASWNGGNAYNIFGAAQMTISGQTIQADFKTFDNPGLVIDNGNLKSFDVSTTSNIKLGNLQVKTDTLDIEYSSGKFMISGGITIDQVFSVFVDLGSEGQGGLEIDVSGSEPKFDIAALTIQLQNLNLGTIDLKNLVLSFDNSGITESAVDVVFPSGTEVAGAMKFTGNPAKLDEITISYRENNLAQAVQLFGGVQMVYLSGTVGNITRPSQLFVSASTELIYGSGFTLAGRSTTLIESGTTVRVNPKSFNLNSTVNVGAYRQNESWNSLLGSGSLNLTVNFSGSVKAIVNVKIPSDPLIETTATVYLSENQDFDALVGVKFYVPKKIPFIGGKKLGSVNGAIRYKNGDLNNSYAAGWTKVKVFKKKYYLGAKYKFKSRSVDTFSKKKAINKIERDIYNDLNSKSVTAPSDYVQDVHSVFIGDDPSPPTMLLLDANWGKEIDSVLITVIGPEGLYELTRSIVLTDTSETEVPEFGHEENIDWVVNDTSAVFILTSPAAFSEEESPNTPLFTGRYQFIFSIPADQYADSVSLEVYPLYQSPTVDIEVNKSENFYEIDMDYWSLVPDSTHLSVYVNNEHSYDSTKLIVHIDANNFDDEGYGTESYTYSPDLITGTDTLHFFAVIDDGTNPPEMSTISEPVLHIPDLHGKITFTDGADSLAEGLRVFIDHNDDGTFDTESSGGIELFTISSTDGTFAISGLDNSLHAVRVMLPPGYRIVGTEERLSHVHITYEGTPIELNLNVEPYTEAE